jgi:hypothetical protein
MGSQKTMIIEEHRNNPCVAEADIKQLIAEMRGTEEMNHDLCDQCEDRNRKNRGRCENCYNNNEYEEEK